MADPIGPPAYAGHEKGQAADKGGITTNRAESLNDIRVSMSSGETKQNTTHRQLKARHIQLIGIGGTIGTVLYVRITSFIYPLNKINNQIEATFGSLKLVLISHSTPCTGSNRKRSSQWRSGQLVHRL